MLAALLLVVGCGKGEDPQALGCSDTEPGERLLRRLTHDEYRRTVFDLTGVNVDAALAADPVVEGFRNDAHALVVGGLLADQYRSAAETVGEEFDVGAHLPCDPGSVGEIPCAALFARDFGLRAFRRPPRDEELRPYVDLFNQVSLESGFDDGIRWMVVAMLQSPHFLYRSELGARISPIRFALTDWEIASALSYSLWGTMPDDELLQVAGRGGLSDDVAIDAQIDRMLSDPRAHETVWHFVESWLDLEQLETVPREGLDDGLRREMARETRERVIEWAEQDAPLSRLLADGGLLTERSVLTTHARPDGSSPVHRGVLVRERLLCEELPPPPPNLDTSPPEVDPTRSTRERYSQHADDPACSSCHDRIDPLGFAFEHFDQLGQWRDDDAGHVIDATGNVDGVPFDGPEQLAQMLLQDARFRECFVYTWRRQVRGTHTCGEDLGTELPISEPLIDVLFTYSFRNRTGRFTEFDTLAMGKLATEELPLPPMGLGGVQFSIAVSNDWGNGYCANGAVSNEGDEPTAWTGRWPADGQVDNIWGAQVDVDGETWVFRGQQHNETLEPGQSTNFGFCARR